MCGQKLRWFDVVMRDLKKISVNLTRNGGMIPKIETSGAPYSGRCSHRIE